MVDIKITMFTVCCQRLFHLFMGTHMDHRMMTRLTNHLNLINSGSEHNTSESEFEGYVVL